MVSALLVMHQNGLLQHEVLHGIVAFPAAYLAFRLNKSIKWSLLVVFLVYAMDIDHLIDYFYFHSSFSLDSFVSVNYFFNGFAYVPFHAWEWIVGLFLFYRYWAPKLIKPIVLSLMLALATHLAWDAYSFKEFAFYSIFYRYFYI